MCDAHSMCMAGEGSFEGYLFAVAALAVFLKYQWKQISTFKGSVIHKVNRMQTVIDSN